MEQKNKLKICLISNFLLLLVVSILMIEFESDSKYCRFGPQDDLIIISVKVDTWNKYYIVLGIIAFIKITKVLIRLLQVQKQMILKII